MAGCPARRGWPTLRVLPLSAFVVLRTVENGCYNNSLLLAIDFVHHNVGQPRHHPFEGIRIATNMANSWKRDQQFYAADQSVDNGLCCRRTVLGDPGKEVLEIGNRLIVENESQ